MLLRQMPDAGDTRYPRRLIGSTVAVDRDCQRIADFAYADVAETTEAIGQRRDRNVLD